MKNYAPMPCIMLFFFMLRHELMTGIKLCSFLSVCVCVCLWEILVNATSLIPLVEFWRNCTTMFGLMPCWRQNITVTCSVKKLWPYCQGSRHGHSVKVLVYNCHHASPGTCLAIKTEKFASYYYCTMHFCEINASMWKRFVSRAHDAEIKYSSDLKNKNSISQSFSELITLIIPVTGLLVSYSINHSIIPVTLVIQSIMRLFPLH